MKSNCRDFLFVFIFIVFCFNPSYPQDENNTTFSSGGWPYGGKLDTSRHINKWVKRPPLTFSMTGWFTDTKFDSIADFMNANFNNGASYSGAVFDSMANFKNAEFQNIVDFFQAKFHDKAYFAYAKFSKEAEFEGVKFDSLADFTEVEFRNMTIFDEVNFKAEAYMRSAKFHNKVSFVFVKFGGYAIFINTIFDGPADFTASQFKGSTSFRNSKFGKQANFRGTIFKGLVKFNNVNFDSTADFNHAKFDSLTSFEEANFVMLADFRNVEFKDQANFKGTKFNREILMDGCVWDSDINFESTVFNAGVDLRRTKFDSVENIYVDHNTSFVNGKFYLYWNQFKARENIRINILNVPRVLTFHDSAQFSILTYEINKINKILNMKNNEIVNLDSILLQKNELIAKLEKEKINLTSIYKIKSEKIKQEHYQRIETFYNRLHDNFNAQGDKSSADAVMYELGWQKKEIMGGLWQTLYGWFFGWGYQPWRFIIFLVLPIILLLAMIWYMFFYTVIVKLFNKELIEERPGLIDRVHPGKDKIVTIFKTIKCFTIYDQSRINNFVNRYARLWQVVFLALQYCWEFVLKKNG